MAKKQKSSSEDEEPTPLLDPSRCAAGKKSIMHYSFCKKDIFIDSFF